MNGEIKDDFFFCLFELLCFPKFLSGTYITFVIKKKREHKETTFI